MLINNSEYFTILESVKSQIRSAQYRAVVGANIELRTLYWNIGNVILENMRWGNKFVENLSQDIKFVQSVTAQIPWTHNKSILDRVKE